MVVDDWTQLVLQMLRTLKSLASFSRRGERPTPAYDDIMEFKWKQLSKYLDRYSSDDKFTHQDKLYEQFVYGHSCHIAATTHNSFQSQKFTKSAVKSLTPRVLILGGISDNFLRVGQMQMRIRQRYQHPIWKAEKMMCRERIARLIQTRLEKDRDFYWENYKKEVVITNHRERRILPSDYLTAAHMASLQGDTRIVLGRPSEEIVFQDLIMRFSKEELQGMVRRAAERARERQGDETSWQESYSLQALHNYVMSEESAVYSRELTYQAALLKRLAKVEDKILLLTPGYFVARVAEQVHHVSVPPQKVYRDGLEDSNSESYYLLQKTLRGETQQILQKFALLCLLKQNHLQKEFGMGINIFKSMSFGQLFADENISSLQNRYLAAKERVSTDWYSLMKHRINNIHILQQPVTRLALGEQFQILSQRASKSFPYTYQQKNYLSVYENRVKLAQLEQRMREILNQEGDKHNIQIFQAFLNKKRSREGIILYSKLLGKANIQSAERLKLPIFHYAAFRGIYKQYLRQFILQAEQNSKYQRKMQQRLNKHEQATKQLMAKLNNPYELNKYLSGQKGKVYHFNMDFQEGPSFSPEDLEDLRKLYGEMTAEDEKEMEQQWGEEEPAGKNGRQ